MAVKSGRVLCVDDEPNILRSLQWLLQKEFEVMTAPSGPDGLELVRKHDFDVVVSDQRMPGMIGSEFLREVRKVSPRSMRILLTGYSDLQAILSSVNESEVFRFINKPWNISELPKAVREAAVISRSSEVRATALIEPETAVPKAGETVLVIDDDPNTAILVEGMIGEHAKIVKATNLAEAIEAFNNERIGVVLSEAHVGNIDTTRLLKMLKGQHPDVITVVSSAESDADVAISLINQGQVYRFVPKPLKAGYLKLAMVSAVLKHQELRENPHLHARHSVEKVAEGTQEALIRDAQEVAKKIAPQGASNDASGSSLLQRLSGGFKRLFGR